MMTHLATAALWVLLASTWAPGVQSGREPCEPLEVFGSAGVPVNLEEICIGRYRTPDCQSYVKNSFYEKYLPAEFPRNARNFIYQRIPRPGDLVLKATTFENNGIIYPGIQVEWSHTEGIERKLLDGFLLIWYNRDSPNKKCQIFQLNTTSPSLTDDLRFKFAIQKVEDNVTLVVHVFSLPMVKWPEIENFDLYAQTRIFHVPPAKYIAWRGVEPAKWAPSIHFKTFNNGSIEIRLSHPPTYMRLFLYEIVVIAESDFTKPVYDEDYKIQDNYNRPTEGILMVQANPQGCYTIMINVKELPEFEMKPGECGCWTLDLDDKQHCEIVCGSSQARLCFNETFGGYKQQCITGKSERCQCCYGFKHDEGSRDSLNCIPDGRTTITKPDKCCRCDDIRCTYGYTNWVCNLRQRVTYGGFKEMYYNYCLDGRDLVFPPEDFRLGTCYEYWRSLDNAFEVLSEDTTFLVIALILGVVLGISLLILMTLIVLKYVSRNKT